MLDVKLAIITDSNRFFQKNQSKKIPNTPSKPPVQPLKPIQQKTAKNILKKEPYKVSFSI
jgi:hypothetical protein